MPDSLQSYSSLFYGPCESHLHNSESEPPDPMTRPCLVYFRHDAKFLKFSGLYAQLGLLATAMRDHAKEISIQFPNVEVEGKIARSFRPFLDTPQEELPEHLEVLNHMTFCAVVDNYLAYVSDLLTLIFKTKPESLKSSQTLEIEEILQYASMDELVNHIAERKVNQLAYKGMEDLNRELTRSLGLTLFDEPGDLTDARGLIEMRNLIVHSRGIVNPLYLSRVHSAGPKLGEQIKVDTVLVWRAREFLSAAVSRVDRACANKFGLETSITRKSCGL